MLKSKLNFNLFTKEGRYPNDRYTLLSNFLDNVKDKLINQLGTFCMVYLIVHSTLTAIKLLLKQHLTFLDGIGIVVMIVFGLFCLVLISERLIKYLPNKKIQWIEDNGKSGREKRN